MRGARSILIALGGAWLTLADAQQPGEPELDFLEYLGSWQERDDEWLMVAEWEAEDKDGRGRKPDQERQEDGEGE